MFVLVLSDDSAILLDELQAVIISIKTKSSVKFDTIDVNLFVVFIKLE